MFTVKSAYPAFLLVCLMTGSGFSQVPKGKSAPVKDEVEALIDRLVEIDRPDTGYSGSTSGTAFLPLGQRQSGAFLLPPGPQTRSDAMRSLVRLGAKAVPKLLEHLSDTRPTKITVLPFISLWIEEDEIPGKKQEDERRYTVMVGDLCYVALGQIVNRPYDAVRYVPSGNVCVRSVPRLKALREDLVKQWGKLTPDKHRESLVQDVFEPTKGRDDIFDWYAENDARNGASIRLAYYYPTAFEAMALRQLARPTYDSDAVRGLIRRELYPAKTAKDRKELVEAYVARSGEIARDGIRWELFDDLRTQKNEEEDPRREKTKPPLKARECLIDVFSLPPTVKGEDRPKVRPLTDTDPARFVETLRYDRSEKIDRIVRDMLIIQHVYFDNLCLDRLVGRGYDADIEAHLKRKLPVLKGDERRELEEYRSKLGWTWVHATVELGVAEMVESALRDKGDANARGRDGRTPLHLAAEAGLDDVAEVLIRSKADPNIPDGKGRLPVELAAHGDHAPVVRRLVTAGSRVPDVFTAATVGATDRMTALLKEKADRRAARNHDGLLTLHVAAREGHLEIVRALLAGGVDVKAVDRLPSTDGETGFTRDWTALHFAAVAGKPAVAELLLDRGADVNAATEEKFTPLLLAASVGNAELVKLLLARKADRTAEDIEHRTALDRALMGKHDAVIKLLEKWARPVSTGRAHCGTHLSFE